MKNLLRCSCVLIWFAGAIGCARHQERPSITAVGLSPANQCDPPGIPYYLPKPLLVIAKNVRHIDESKVGLTAPVPIPGGFDNQAAYGDLKANVTVPGGSGTAASSGSGPAISQASLAGSPSHTHVGESMMPSQLLDDGIEPDSFFTYQVIFVPDLTQKYGLQISGGAGEFRAAMNMVNGWMYTGAGPFYMKDSSSAQNAMATGAAAMFAGRGVADVLEQVGGLTQAIGSLPKKESTTAEDVSRLCDAVEAFALATNAAPRVAKEMLNYAEVYIYEPYLSPDQTTDWRLVAEHHFDRHYFDREGQPMTSEQKVQVLQNVLQAAASQTQVFAPPASLSEKKKESATGDDPADNSSEDTPLQRAFDAMDLQPAGQNNLPAPSVSPSSSPTIASPDSQVQSNQTSSSIGWNRPQTTSGVQINIQPGSEPESRKGDSSKTNTLGALLRHHGHPAAKHRRIVQPSRIIVP